MKLAVVKYIQVGGVVEESSLEDACKCLLGIAKDGGNLKIYFGILLPNGEERSITIRDEGDQTYAYGDFEGLPSFLDFARDITKEVKP